jgi:hypothetical protein
VRYDAGLEGMVSGGKLCEGLTSLLVIALGFESATPVDLRIVAPESCGGVGMVTVINGFKEVFGKPKLYRYLHIW